MLRTGTIAVCMLALLLVGCSPDLIPTNPKGMSGFCNVDDMNRLEVSVKNDGSEDAIASTAQVDFGTYGVVNIVTPVLKEGEEVTLPSIDFPAGCSDPDCGFEIKVDIFNDVSEGSGEDNNTQVGNCVG